MRVQQKTEAFEMSEEIMILIAAVYAGIVALSFKRVGMLSAIMWPITIILLGLYVFFVTALSQPPKDE
jgi:uncharacterized membrane protein YvlD (DUF360 family)